MDMFNLYLEILCSSFLATSYETFQDIWLKIYGQRIVVLTYQSWLRFFAVKPIEDLIFWSVLLQTELHQSGVVKIGVNQVILVS